MEEPKYNPNEKPKNSDDSESTDKPLMENIFAQLNDEPKEPEQQGWLPAEWNIDKKQDEEEDEEESDSDTPFAAPKVPRKGFFASYFGIDRDKKSEEAAEDPEPSQETPAEAEESVAEELAVPKIEAPEEPEETIELPEPVPLTEIEPEPVPEPEAELDTEEPGPVIEAETEPEPEIPSVPTLETEDVAPEPETTPVRTETVIVDRDPGLAVAAFAGAEILSRNRDRKLKHRINDQEKDIKKVEDRTEQLVDRVKEQEEANNKLRAHLLATKEKFAEQPIVKNEKPYLKPENLPKTETPEVQMPQIEKKEAPVFKPENVYKAPEITPTKIEKAIEKDEPIESALEHRHEIKGENTQLPGAYSVAEVLENLQAEQQNLQTAIDQTNQNAAWPTVRATESKASNGEVYKHAVLGGVTAALVIIVFGVIAYLATH